MYYEWFDITKSKKILPSKDGEFCLVTIAHPCPGESKLEFAYDVHSAFYVNGHFRVDGFKDTINPYIVAWTPYPSYHYDKSHKKILSEIFFKELEKYYID